MNYVKVDNAYLRDKMDLRIDHLPAGDVNVLDCFSGKGVIWRAIRQQLPDRKIRVLPIDKRYDIRDMFHLAGNNVDFMSTLDLAKFNVIDLDAYGTPYAQLAELFRRRYTGTVFVTYIDTAMGKLPFDLLEELGFPRKMITKSPTLFAIRAWQYLREWLAQNGVRRIHHRSHTNGQSSRHYIAFTLASEAAA